MIYFYIFALLLTTSPAFSFEWNAGMVSGHHQVFWARGCDFNGRDLRNEHYDFEDCTSLCLSEPQCTHFTQGGGICYLKHSTDFFYANEQNNDDICGFVTPRSKQVPTVWHVENRIQYSCGSIKGQALPSPIGKWVSYSKINWIVKNKSCFFMVWLQLKAITLLVFFSAKYKIFTKKNNV